MRLSLRDMAAHLGLALPLEDTAGICATSVVTDSRKVTPGALFVCIGGTRTDGHAHAAAAVAAGASLVLASRPLPEITAPVLQVEDTVRALGQLAALWRGRTQARVTGITGTAGKTTLKETLAHILTLCGKTARNAMNFNNQIGMPSAMLNTDGDEAFWVMEAGISHDGDMDELAPVLRPDLGLILNVGPGHTEGLGGRGVAWHKARLLAHLAEGGTGLVCADYPELCHEVAALHVPVRYFSTQDDKADFHAVWLGQQGRMGRYRLRLEGREFDVLAPFGGAYGAENCIAAAAAAHMLGIGPDAIAQGLASAVLPVQRFGQERLGNWDIIDDTYNANPLSMRRMLDAAAAQAGGRPLALVLGEMGELGQDSAALHEELGRYLAQLGPTAIFWVGGQVDAVHAGLRAGGYTGLWRPVKDTGAFSRAWRETMHTAAGGLILLKGSRSNGLENHLKEVRALLALGADAHSKGTDD
ncbi:MAG: UDP-N-acetylmuramoyl-tripeptide--D-alanyl-D-alanine ligase [Desulfovibrionaceae bacterium]|nr:UDP-N-acetylmuramoyl-tripeptide--D-alanyl-D-alanine ligase [Desulfovibrionaceae bacterium]